MEDRYILPTHNPMEWLFGVFLTVAVCGLSGMSVSVVISELVFTRWTNASNLHCFIAVTTGFLAAVALAIGLVFHVLFRSHRPLVSEASEPHIQDLPQRDLNYSVVRSFEPRTRKVTLEELESLWRNSQEDNFEELESLWRNS